jgi:hypothetical protein
MPAEIVSAAVEIVTSVGDWIGGLMGVPGGMLKSCRPNRDKVVFPRESVLLTRNSRVQIVTKPCYEFTQLQRGVRG